MLGSRAFIPQVDPDNKGSPAEKFYNICRLAKDLDRGATTDGDNYVTIQTKNREVFINALHETTHGMLYYISGAVLAKPLRR